MKKRMTALVLSLMLLLSCRAMAAGYRLADGNEQHFADLFLALLHAYETPSAGDEQAVDSALQAIEGVSAKDGQIAKAVADHWMRVYVDADRQYVSYLYGGGDKAVELDGAGIPEGSDHAFVILGFELKDGEMTDELKGRCDAAAAAARSYPDAILVCSGGATGDNNPHKHTEAGLMKTYLVQKGIEPERIYIDERAQTTVDNAVNTLQILMQQGTKSMTIVTSSYHQRWGQVIYNAMAAICRQMKGYSVQITGNYSYAIEAEKRYRNDDRIAIRQLCSILQIPDDIIEQMKRDF